MNFIWETLGNLPHVSTHQDISYHEPNFERVWLEHKYIAPSDPIHPIDNMPNYGSSQAWQTSEAALMLNLNFTRGRRSSSASFVFKNTR